MRILFMGTPDFAEICLNRLIEAGENVVGVISQPDKPQGRKMILTPPPVKLLAEKHGIPVYQPKTLKDSAISDLLDELCPDIIAVVAYGKILPRYVLDFPAYGCVNIHASLLPKLRGAAPIQWSIIRGEKETGVTSMYMSEGLDTGDMILRKKTEILPEETAEELFDRLAELGGELLIETLHAIREGTAVRTVQDDGESTYAPILTRENGHVDFSKSAETIHNLVRGLYSWPCAYSFYKGKKFKILACRIAEGSGKPGEVLKASAKDGLIVAAGEGAIRITELQFEGKKRMSASDYFAGNQMDPGEILE